jgi:predicted DCC family thiol-disulfide oxidoreductase YuxK
MGPTDPLANQPLILFDGVCNLCNGTVVWILKHDPKALFRFAPLQSAIGEKILLHFGISPGILNSIILISGDKLFQRSGAVLEISRNLSAPWSWLGFFRIVPEFIRDGLYNLIARNRYFLFGKKDVCSVPEPAWHDRFVA